MTQEISLISTLLDQALRWLEEYDIADTVPVSITLEIPIVLLIAVLIGGWLWGRENRKSK